MEMYNPVQKFSAELLTIQSGLARLREECHDPLIKYWLSRRSMEIDSICRSLEAISVHSYNDEERDGNTLLMELTVQSPDKEQAVA